MVKTVWSPHDIAFLTQMFDSLSFFNHCKFGTFGNRMRCRLQMNGFNQNQLNDIRPHLIFSLIFFSLTENQHFNFKYCVYIFDNGEEAYKKFQGVSWFNFL